MSELHTFNMINALRCALSVTHYVVHFPLHMMFYTFRCRRPRIRLERERQQSVAGERVQHGVQPSVRMASISHHYVVRLARSDPVQPTPGVRQLFLDVRTVRGQFHKVMKWIGYDGRYSNNR